VAEVARAEPVHHHRRDREEQHLQQEQQPRIGPQPVQGGHQDEDVAGVLAEQVEATDGHEWRLQSRQQPRALVVDAEVEAVGAEPVVQGPGGARERDHEQRHGHAEGGGAQGGAGDAGGGDQPAAEVEQGALDGAVGRRRRRRRDGRDPAAAGRQPVASQPRRQPPAAGRGEQLHLGGAVEGVDRERARQAEHLGVPLRVGFGAMEVEQVELREGVGGLLEGGDVGVAGRPVQRQGEPAAAVAVEGDGRGALAVQRQVGGGQPVAPPGGGRRRPGRRDRWRHYHADPAFMLTGPRPLDDDDRRRTRWRRSRPCHQKG
jgi:hypothetical protein